MSVPDRSWPSASYSRLSCSVLPMPKATPPTSWPSTSAGFTARPTSAPTTTRRSPIAPVSRSTSTTTAAAQPAYVIFLTSNEAPAARPRSAASSASVTRRPPAFSTPCAYVTSASVAPRRAAARAFASAISFFAARCAALPAVSVPREPYVPTPLSTAAVSACRTSNRSAGMPSASPRICASTVSRPGPIEEMPYDCGTKSFGVTTVYDFGEERGKIAGVVHGRDAEGLRAAVVGHLFGADEVAAADLRRVEPEPRRAGVHQPLADEVALRPARRAQCARRRLVRHDRPQVAGVVRHAVRAGQQRGAEFRGDERRRPHVGADVGPDQRADGEDAPVGVEADLDLVTDLARVVGGHEVLAPALDPLHGPAERH